MTGSQFMNALGLFYFFWKNLKLVLINICTLDEMILEMEATSQRKYVMLDNLLSILIWLFMISEYDTICNFTLGRALCCGFYL